MRDAGLDRLPRLIDGANAGVKPQRDAKRYQPAHQTRLPRFSIRPSVGSGCTTMFAFS